MLNRKVEVKNGLSTLFWEDPWIKDKPLCILFRVLYDLCLDKFVCPSVSLTECSATVFQMATSLLI